MTANRDRRKPSRAIRVLIVMQGVTALLAIAALYWSLTIQQSDLNRQNAARIQGRYQTCQLLRGLVLVSGSASSSHRKAALAFLAATPLRDCQTYASQKG